MACWNLLKLTRSTLRFIKRQDHVLTTLSWLECILFMQKAYVDHEICCFLQSMKNWSTSRHSTLPSLYTFDPYSCIALFFYFLFKWHPTKPMPSQRYVISFQPTLVKCCSLHKFNILKWLILFLLILIRTLAYR